MANNTQNIQTVESQVTELYVSTFGRAPDQAGLTYWTDQVLNGNLTIEQVGKSFFDQPETKTKYDGISNDQFVNNVYHNVLNHDADQAGHDYWVEQLNEGKITHDKFITAVTNAATEVKDGVAVHADDKSLVDNKVTTGLDYAKQIGTADSPLASQVLKNVTSDASSVEDAMGTVHYYKGWVDKYSDALGTDSGVTKDDLYKHLDKPDYWNKLEEDHSIKLDTNSNTKFWDVSKDVWTDTPSNSKSDTKFDFLKDKNDWQSPDSFTKFHDGEFSNMTNDKLFHLEASKTGDMYADNLAKTGDLSALDGISKEDITGMFSNVSDAKFADILSKTGDKGLNFFDTHMNNFDDKITKMDDTDLAKVVKDTGKDGADFLNTHVSGFDTKMNGMDANDKAGLNDYFKDGNFSLDASSSLAQNTDVSLSGIPDSSNANFHTDGF